MSFSPKRAVGCGCGCILAVVVVIALIGWALSFMGGTSPIRTLQQVPSDVPPARGKEVPAIDVDAPGRTSDKLDFWAEPLSQETSIPAAALRAYGNAELIAAQSYPDCHISWNTLAGIGYVETRHGTYTGKVFGGASIESDGVVRPTILGIQLDGSPGFESIPDSDNGELDGDPEFDRAVGPMQFIPQSWEKFGRDASGDGVADPNQIDDAAVAAANLLCSRGGDLATADGWTRAVRSYNNSRQYLIDVRDAAASYAIGQPPL